jgi:hypothetical protein
MGFLLGESEDDGHLDDLLGLDGYRCRKAV